MRKPILRAGVAAATAAVLAACGGTASTEGMPDQIVWSTYGTGTSTYADVAAVADAITTNEGSTVRVITSDTAIGRMTPLREKQAQLARTGDEYIFSFEGDYDFATEEWGPQDVRTVWMPVAPHGLLVKDDSGIETFEDLRGRKFPTITANPSVNNKLEAFLAYGGLTWDDVEVVEVGYSDQPAALQAGSIDVLFQQVYGPSLYELESAVPVRWLDMEDTSAEKLQTVQEVAPSVVIGEFSGAPGQEDGEKTNGLIYSVPVVTYADVEEETIYNIVKAIHDNYAAYAKTTPTTPDWSIDAAQVVPREVPFHDGAVKFLEEKGAWTPEAQETQEALIKRGEELRAGWPEFLEQTEGGELAEAWTEWKSQNMETP